MPSTEGIYDAYNDPYAQKRTARKRRSEFENLKRTKAFKKWRKEQYSVQTGKCAYCRIPLHYKDIVTHVDHIQPLRFDGTNAFTNLLLSCRRCNTKKYIATNRATPDWVRVRKEVGEKNKKLAGIRKAQANQMKQIMEREFQDQLAWELKQMFQ